MRNLNNLNAPEASYIIRISYLGYKTKETVCSSGDIGTIILDTDTQTLDEVVVKGERPLVKMVNNRLTYNIGGILETKIVSNAHELIKELPSVMSLDGNSLSLVGSTSTTICINGKKSTIGLSIMGTPTIQGIWDLESNWGVNAGVRYSFLNDNAVLSLQCNDLFESMYPETNVRFESQNQNVNQNSYSRNITLSFTYKFKGYKNKTRKEVDTSRFGIQ